MIIRKEAVGKVCHWLLTFVFFLQLEDGDIICYLKSPVIDNDDQFRYPDVPSFLEYVHNRQVSFAETILCINKPTFISSVFLSLVYTLVTFMYS